MKRRTFIKAVLGVVAAVYAPALLLGEHVREVAEGVSTHTSGPMVWHNRGEYESRFATIAKRLESYDVEQIQPWLDLARRRRAALKKYNEEVDAYVLNSVWGVTS